ncbi:MAG: PH domain-containing protein [Desulfobacterales bacterium]|nr:PH domain-containing protein [Desulfobacterales bacterium]
MVSRIDWFPRFFFPSLWISLNAYELYLFAQDGFPIDTLTYFDWFMVFLSAVVSYFIFYILSVRYEIKDNELNIRSFFIRQQNFSIKDILFIKDEGIVSKDRNQFFGLRYFILHFKNGKKVIISGLSDQYRFMQLLKSKLSA